jgi:hypothetical protein
MSASAGANKLSKSIQTLHEKWELTEADWRDQKRLELGRDVIEPLQVDVNGAMRAMKLLDETLSRIRRECSPSREL